MLSLECLSRLKIIVLWQGVINAIRELRLNHASSRSNQSSNVIHNVSQQFNYIIRHLKSLQDYFDIDHQTNE